ncbi:unnamed protein product [Meloidogyne enterolobii]|uniref:Uncharacterized protein n=1 Tax=Meloidogyne enterolobii TaxID=390850 RepID=A0ACB0Y216_MELEN
MVGRKLGMAAARIIYSLKSKNWHIHINLREKNRNEEIRKIYIFFAKISLYNISKNPSHIPYIFFPSNISPLFPMILFVYVLDS